jgi:phage terminase large subunit-like protein
MPRAVRKQDISQTEALGLLAEKLKLQAREPNILAYKPHFKQETFHRSDKPRRLYIGGNRSGKTVGGICEDIWYLKGEHPFKSVPPAPVRGRIVCVDYNQGINQIIIPKLKQWLPSSLLIGGSWDRSYDSQSKVLTLSNGSTCELMTYEQKLDSFAGTSRHFVHFDEEPPKHIYDECAMRLLDTDGDAWLTMTPVNGMTWIYDSIFEPIAINGEKDPDTDIIIVDVHENPYLNPAAIERTLKSLDPDERKAREKGQFVSIGGLVYKNFDKNSHVISFDASLMNHVRACEIYTSMDHGYNAPTAWLWHAVAADGTIITFSEHYQAEMTVREHAEAVKSRETQLQIPEPVMRIADPATNQRQGVTGVSIQVEYANQEIYLSDGNNDVPAGVARVQQYLKENPATKRPYWLITDNCVNLIRELQKLRWATFATAKGRFDNNPQEKIHKKDDHAADAARYFFITALPEIEIEEEPKKKTGESSMQRYDEALAQMGKPVSASSTVWNWNPGSVMSIEGE